jgi:hypothetical protein
MEQDTKSFPKLRLQVQNESLIFISDKLIFSCEKTTRIPTTQPLLYLIQDKLSLSGRVIICREVSLETVLLGVFPDRLCTAGN